MKAIVVTYGFLIFGYLSHLAVDNVRWYNIHEVEEVSRKENRPVILKIYAGWCKPCQNLGQSFESVVVKEALDGEFILSELDVEYAGNIHFRGKDYGFTDNLKMNINELALSFMGDTIAFPMVVVFNSAWEPVYTFRGTRDPEALSKEIENIKNNL